MYKWSHVVKRLIFISIVVTGCVEPYSPPAINKNISIVVVDGFINGTDGSATVRLTKAVALIEEDEYPTVTGAVVKIRSEKGDSYTLSEEGSGQYTAHGLIVDPATKYQLTIHTSGDGDIISDYISLTQTPPIDSITWRPDEAGITIYVNTHDDTKRSRYYHWDYVETWNYQSPYMSQFTKLNGEIISREPKDLTSICYKTVPSTNIVVGSTVRLSEDVVHDLPLTYIPQEDSKLSILYSILVRQRVIEETEYKFWQDLQKVTESVGGLFDSQPYEILGNVHAMDGSVPVLGYFSAGFMAEKRLFVSLQDLPKELQKRPFNGCHLDSVCLIAGPSVPFQCAIDVPNLPENSYLISTITLDGALLGYTMSTMACADCRVQGGVLEKPDFWP